MVSSVNSLNEKKSVIWAFSLVAVVGAAIGNILPLLVGAFSASGFYSDSEVGYLASADMLGICLATGFGFLWVKRMGTSKHMHAMLLVFIVANFLCTQVESFSTMLLLRVVCGLSAGAAYSIAVVYANGSNNSDKAFAFIVMAQVVWAAVSLLVIPYVLTAIGISGLFWWLSISAAIALVVSVMFGGEINAESRLDGGNESGTSEGKYLVMFATLLWFVGIGSIWSYTSEIGVRQGISVEETGLWLSLGYAFSVFGNVAAVTVAGRVSRSHLILISGILQLVSVAIWGSSLIGNSIVFFLATVIFSVAWAIFTPFQMAMFGEAGGARSVILMFPAVTYIGMGLGTMFASVLVGESSYSGVIILSSISLAVSLMLYMYPMRREILNVRLSRS